MADTKTDSSSTPLPDDPVIPAKRRLSAKPNTASQTAGAEPGLDTLFHRTNLRFCCASNLPTASEARDPDGYRDCSNRCSSSFEDTTEDFGHSGPSFSRVEVFPRTAPWGLPTDT